MIKHLALSTAALTLLAPSLASAAETVAYSYDARGRLVQVVRMVDAGAPVTTTYTYDKAGNRTQTTTTGA